MKRKTYVPFGSINEWAKRPDANLCLIKPGKGIFDDYQLIRFASRKALEEFNKKAGLKPLVFTQVPKNMAVYAHESDREARKKESEHK